MNDGIHINDIFMWTYSIDKMREFYSGVLGLKEAWYETDKSEYGNAYLAYKFGNQTLHFINRAEDHQPFTDWAYQPSSEISGGAERLSFTLEMSREHLEQISPKIFGSDIPHYQDKIDERDGYSALTVRDPMGNTLDLYYKT